jgi:acyl-CoA synthetase (AMP-forming)/AMP-acid ligase II
MTTLSPASILAVAARRRPEHRAKHKYPRRVEFEALPLGPGHKVLERELRERFGTVR